MKCNGLKKNQTPFRTIKSTNPLACFKDWYGQALDGWSVFSVIRSWSGCCWEEADRKLKQDIHIAGCYLNTNLMLLLLFFLNGGSCRNSGQGLHNPCQLYGKMYVNSCFGVLIKLSYMYDVCCKATWLTYFKASKAQNKSYVGPCSFLVQLQIWLWQLSILIYIIKCWTLLVLQHKIYKMHPYSNPAAFERIQISQNKMKCTVSAFCQNHSYLTQKQSNWMFEIHQGIHSPVIRFRGNWVYANSNEVNVNIKLLVLWEPGG